jgi:hypothetical protein
MKARIEYEVRLIPHPWNPPRRDAGVQVWCLIKRVVPEMGHTVEEPVAAFNLDSEALTFMGHVISSGLDGKLVTVDLEFTAVYPRRQV